MIIDASNKEIINTKAVYYHDDILTGFTFDRARKKLRLRISKWETEKRTEIIFQNVIGFAMSSCDFWGINDERILGFCLLEPEQEVLIPKIYKKREKEECCPLKAREVYFETAMSFVTGDNLFVACERIVLERSELENAAE